MLSLFKLFHKIVFVFAFGNVVLVKHSLVELVPVQRWFVLYSKRGWKIRFWQRCQVGR